MKKQKPSDPAKSQQLLRFREMAREVEADEAPGALDRAFGRLDMKKKDTGQTAKRAAKPK